jgi:PAS domain S-box-containing protein
MYRILLTARPYSSSNAKSLGIALAATAAAASLSLVSPAVRAVPCFLFFGAVVASAWFGGLRGGLLAAGLGTVLVRIVAPLWSAAPAAWLPVVLSLLLYGGAAWVVSRLGEAQEHAGAVLAAIGEGFCVVDRRWIVSYINPWGAEMAGKSAREIVGRSCWEMLPDALGTPDEQQLRRCAIERMPVRFETRSLTLGRWLRVRAYPIAGGISILFEDISAAKEREEMLHASLDRLSAAHKAAQMGTWDWNLKTNALIWTDEILAVHGMTADQFDGNLETWIKTIHPEDLASVQARLEKALAEKSEFYAEFRVAWPNGEIHWVVGRGRVIVDSEGTPLRMVGMGADITQRRREEEALVRSEKLAAAGRLAATIAHEINNPLEAISNLIYLLRQDPSNRRDADLLRMADEQLARVNHIAKQTLGFYRDRNVAEAVDVAQTLEELLSILQSRINSKQLSMEREYDEIGPLKAFRGELRQVFSNLLTNAIDASPSGGKLILRIKEQVERGTKGKLTLIEIEDFGSGIQPGDRERIFEPFFTTKQDFGTGLGLWVTRQLVEKNSGSIDFRSNCQPGQSGTCFRVMFPASGNAEQPASTKSGVPGTSLLRERAS